MPRAARGNSRRGAANTNARGKRGRGAGRGRGRKVGIDDEVKTPAPIAETRTRNKPAAQFQSRKGPKLSDSSESEHDDVDARIDNDPPPPTPGGPKLRNQHDEGSDSDTGSITRASRRKRKQNTTVSGRAKRTNLETQSGNNRARSRSNSLVPSSGSSYSSSDSSTETSCSDSTESDRSRRSRSNISFRSRCSRGSSRSSSGRLSPMTRFRNRASRTPSPDADGPATPRPKPPTPEPMLDYDDGPLTPMGGYEDPLSTMPPPTPMGGYEDPLSMMPPPTPMGGYEDPLSMMPPPTPMGGYEDPLSVMPPTPGYGCLPRGSSPPPATPRPSRSRRRRSPAPDPGDYYAASPATPRNIKQRASPPPEHFDMPPPTPGISLKNEPRTPASSKRGRRNNASLLPTDENQVAIYDPPPTPGAKSIAVRDLSGSTIAIYRRNQQLFPPGTIKSVTMQNIMSHSKFFQVWNPTVNFVIGENGSGKSAILSAIVAGLGGKAFDTGRAPSMKGIIKSGQTKAKIEVVLNNYSDSHYGDEIRIIRTLSREGNSRYQIKDSKKGLRSLNRHDLNLLLSKLNIQVDNPLAILHQELSKNFLRTTDPQRLYSYFYRALLLGPCEVLLNKAWKDLDDAGEQLVKKKKMLVELRAQERKLKENVELIESLKDVYEHLKVLDREFAWKVVEEIKEDVELAKQEFQKAQTHLEDANQEKKQNSGKYHRKSKHVNCVREILFESE